MPSRRTSAKDRPKPAKRRRAGLLARRDAPAEQRADPAEAPKPPSASVVPARFAGGRDLFDERRLRDSGGPEDTATYQCGCGYVWRASVTASVACPHCGAGQAW